MVADDEVVLIDWGFACESDKSYPFSGTVSFGSDILLQQLFSSLRYSLSPIMVYKKSHDCESLLKTFCYYFSKARIGGSHLEINIRISESLKFWSTYSALNYQKYATQLKKEGCSSYSILRDFINNISYEDSQDEQSEDEGSNEQSEESDAE